MNKQNQWLFEVPFTSKSTQYNNHYSGEDRFSSFELSAEWKAPAFILKSPRFNADSRLQAAANNNPPMRAGEQGHAVQKLQQALIDLGFPMPITTQRGASDGIYGAETVATVRKFQMKYGLQVDGIAGRQTLGQLDNLFTSPNTGGKCQEKSLGSRLITNYTDYSFTVNSKCQKVKIELTAMWIAKGCCTPKKGQLYTIKVFSTNSKQQQPVHTKNLLAGIQGLDECIPPKKAQTKSTSFLAKPGQYTLRVYGDGDLTCAQLSISKGSITFS